MWSSIFPFLFGAASMLFATIWLLFRWDPSPMIEAALAQRRRRHPFPLTRSPNEWEEKQRQALRPHIVPPQLETCVWINSIAQYAFAHVSERLNAAAADGRLEAAINQRLAKKKFPDFVCAPVLVSELSVGSALPVLQAVHVTSADPTLPLEFHASVCYHGSAFVVVGTSVCVPHLPFISLPVEVAVKELQVDATARFSIDVSQLPRVRVSVTFDPSLQLDFQLHSHLGHKLILEDLHLLQTAFKIVAAEVLKDDIIEPNVIELELEAWQPGQLQGVAASATAPPALH